MILGLWGSHTTSQHIQQCLQIFQIITIGRKRCYPKLLTSAQQTEPRRPPKHPTVHSSQVYHCLPDLNANTVLRQKFIHSKAIREDWSGHKETSNKSIWLLLHPSNCIFKACASPIPENVRLAHRAFFCLPYISIRLFFVSWSFKCYFMFIFFTSQNPERAGFIINCSKSISQMLIWPYKVKMTEACPKRNEHFLNICT